MVSSPQIRIALFIRAADAGGRVGYAMHAVDIDRHLRDGRLRHVIVRADILSNAANAGKSGSDGDLFCCQEAQRARRAHNGS